VSREGKRIQAVVFDLDDTLIDWSQPEKSWDEYTRPMTDNLHKHLATAGYELPERDAFFQCLRQEVEHEWTKARENWMGASFSEVLRRTLQVCNIDESQVDLEELMRVYDWQPMPGVVLYEDALDVLAQLRQHSYKLGLITNSFLPMWMRDVELRHYNLIDLFDARLTSGDAGYMKPHPAIYHRLLEMLGTTPEQSVFVGDRPQNDIAGANEAGMISVLIDPPHLEREVNEHEPDFTIERLSELIDVLEGLEIGD
jgi:putative hydrolase of the HAD superfamily